MTSDEYRLINERIGVLGATVLLVGMTIGISIFVVPTQMLVEAGPAVFLASLVSILPMMLGVLLMIQLGTAIPVAGGVYVYASRLVGPFWGLVAVIIPVVAIWAYLVFAAIGFAQYVHILVSSVPVIPAAWLILGVFLIINYTGIRVAVQSQILMVAVLLFGMFSFIVAGTPVIDPANYTPVFPDELYADGIVPLLVAAVALYIPLQGFGIVIEIGEELEDPMKNIPRILALGMAIVTVLMVGLVFVLVGAVHWELLTGPDGEPVDGGLAVAATLFGPEWLGMVIAVAALIAAATTINTLFTAYSRTVMRAARDELVPQYFAEVHEQYRTPTRAIGLLGIPAVLFVPLAITVDSRLAVEILDWLVVFIVTGLLIAFMILGIALWRLPERYPERYEQSYYRLPLPVLRLVAAGNVIVSLLLAGFVAIGMPSALLVLLAVLIAGYGGYRYRIRRYEQKGIDIKKRMSMLDDHEQSGPAV